jgi:hypothetical protein
MAEQVWLRIDFRHDSDGIEDKDVRMEGGQNTSRLHHRGVPLLVAADRLVSLRIRPTGALGISHRLGSDQDEISHGSDEISDSLP